jgi:3-deoxy-manno-octulosonate cytidylyltransferase (CMP-KDO synthetase)
MTALGVIPARLGSTRLPRKVLREIAGRPMLWHVWQRARQARSLSAVLVATDAEEVVQACRGLGIPTLLTSPDHPSGTDRVWEVAQHRFADVYVNIQGDEPLVTAGHVERLLEPFRNPQAQVSTLCIRAAADELPNPNVVKVVRDPEGRALYFSRCPIPYDRDSRGAARFKHIGLYAYRRSSLEAFHRSPASPLELTERLEQLRFLENGIPIMVMETNEPTVGVDTEEDLRAVEAVLAAPRPS